MVAFCFTELKYRRLDANHTAHLFLAWNPKNNAESSVYFRSLIPIRSESGWHGYHDVRDYEILPSTFQVFFNYRGYGYQLCSVELNTTTESYQGGGFIYKGFDYLHREVRAGRMESYYL